ncbi:MAG: hypothetical protein RJA19_124 [Bacteroidota bacterium]|jgi:hypothetical protein
MKFNNSTPSRLGGAQGGNRRLEENPPQEVASGEFTEAPEAPEAPEMTNTPEVLEGPEVTEAAEAAHAPESATEREEEQVMEAELEAEGEAEEEEAAPAGPRRPEKVGLRDLLSGEVLTREGVLANVPYLLFLTSLFVAYVALGYQFERIEREKQRTLRRVRELNAEFKSLEAAFETQLQQSQVESQVAPLGLGQSLEPPFVIEVEPLESEAR